MVAKIFPCTELADKIQNQCKSESEAFYDRYNRRPCLAVILVGEDPASQVYVRKKTEACTKASIEARDIKLPNSISQSDLEKAVHELNEDDSVDGILLQSPLPAQIDEKYLHTRIHIAKDVDCFHPYNIGLLSIDTKKQLQQGLIPCTPAGVIDVLQENKIKLEGKSAVVVGRSDIVGKPMALMLQALNATVTVCHSHTKNMHEICKSADILVAAVGKPKLIDAKFIKPGAVLIDVGINRIESNGKKILVGDIDRQSVLPIASFLTPVPKGIGAMTIACLLRNTVRAAKQRALS